MKILPWAEITTDLPDDRIEDENGDFIRQPGKNVIEAVAEVLRNLGAKVKDPEDAGDHGWDMIFYWKNRRFWCQITAIENYIFNVEDGAMISKIFPWNQRIYVDLMTHLADALAAYPRFQKVRWYSSEDVLGGSPGAERSVIR